MNEGFETIEIWSKFDDASDKLTSLGYCVLPNAFDEQTLLDLRRIVTVNRENMPNTRKSAYARHVAGFERFSEFENLFSLIDSNTALNDFFRSHFGHSKYSSFGLSDITVNRSQHWHTDLLRGKFAHHLEGIDAWSSEVGSCIKALFYLQDGRSLKVVPKSHLAKTPLDDRLLEKRVTGEKVEQIAVTAGDIVMMDIRCLHRGSTEEAMGNPSLAENPKILVSNVYSEDHSSLRAAMSAGNQERQRAWDFQHIPADSSLRRSLTNIHLSM